MADIHGNVRVRGLDDTTERVVSTTDGTLSAPTDNLLMDGFITDIDVIAAIVTATYNLSNAYTVSITPANSKKALAGQLYVAGGFLYVVVAENIISRYGIQTLFNTAVGSIGTAPNWSISSVEMGNTLTLNIPLAAAANTSGTISNAAQTIAGAKTLTALLTCQAGIFIAASGSRNAAAALQVDSTTQGILPPRMTGAQMNAIATPPDGLMVHVTDAATVPIGFYGRVSGAWVRFTTGVIDVLGTVLTGLNIVNAAIVASDNILQALGKAQGQINERSLVGHTHDNRYYTETEIDNFLQNKENSLGNPAVNGYVLSSSISGTRSWIPINNNNNKRYAYISTNSNTSYDANPASDLQWVPLKKVGTFSPLTLSNVDFTFHGDFFRVNYTGVGTVRVAVTVNVNLDFWGNDTIINNRRIRLHRNTSAVYSTFINNAAKTANFTYVLDLAQNDFVEIQATWSGVSSEPVTDFFQVNMLIQEL